jgi:hypothetical protein
MIEKINLEKQVFVFLGYDGTNLIAAKKCVEKVGGKIVSGLDDGSPEEQINAINVSIRHAQEKDEKLFIVCNNEFLVSVLDTNLYLGFLQSVGKQSQIAQIAKERNIDIHDFSPILAENVCVCYFDFKKTVVYRPNEYGHFLADMKEAKSALLNFHSDLSEVIYAYYDEE